MKNLTKIIYGLRNISYSTFQVTIPKEIREKLGIAKGDKLILDLKENKIIITKS